MIRWFYTLLVKQIYKNLPALEHKAKLQTVLDLRAAHASRTLQVVDMAEKTQGWSRQKRRALQREIAGGRVGKRTA